MNCHATISTNFPYPSANFQAHIVTYRRAHAIIEYNMFYFTFMKPRK